MQSFSEPIVSDRIQAALRRRCRRLLIVAAGAVVALMAPTPFMAAQVPAPAAGFTVVVHADNPATSIEREQLSRMFLKRVSKWPDGRPAEPIDLATSQPARLSFSASIHKKTVGAIRAFWQQQIFSGRDVPPAEKGSENDVMTYVQEHAGAVGYVSAGAALGSGLKVLVVHGVRP